ncbi:MAG: cupin domain-containing protein [Thermoanaerobaculia bacterium]
MTFQLARILCLAILATVPTAASTGGAEPDPAVLAYKLPADFRWKDSTEFPGLQSVVLSGDPSKPGPYVTRNRFAPGRFSRPHFHPNDRFIVVVSGTWWVGTGETFDPESTKAMPMGSFVTHFGGKVHYDGAKTDPCEVVIFGLGPATATPVGPR